MAYLREKTGINAAAAAYIPYEGRIVLDPGYPEDRLRVHLAHEVEHLVFDLAGLSGSRDVDEEGVVTASTPTRLMIERDNPTYMAWLLAR